MRLTVRGLTAGSMLLMISLVSTGWAQWDGPGLKFGLNMATQSGSEHFYYEQTGGTGSSEVRRGFCVAGFITYHLNDWLALQPEVMLTVKGGNYLDQGQSHYVDSVGYAHKLTWENEETWKLTYLEIPLLAKVTIPVKSSFKPTLSAGPALGINLTSSLDWIWSGSDAIENSLVDTVWYESSKDDIDDLALVELSLVAGCGFDYDLETSRIVVELRYTYGLTQSSRYQVDFSKPAFGFFTAEGLSIRNRVLTILVGYSF